jgi:rRNA maturation endonuclease Nob1
MSESTSSLVECPVCGEEFDPTAAGGWCTNSECGQWRYEDVEVAADETAADDDDLTTEPPADVDAEENEAEEELEPDSATDEGGVGGDETGSSEPEDAVPEMDPDVTDTDDPLGDAAEATDTEQAPSAAGGMADLVGGETGDDADNTDEAGDASEDSTTSAEPQPAGEGSEPDAEPAPTAETLDEESEDDLDLREPDADAVDTAATDESAQAVAETEAVDAAAVDEAASTEEAAEIDCPGCGTTLDADTNFCPSCGEDVSGVEPGDDDEDEAELTACPSCDADVGPDDSFCASCGEDLDAHRGGDQLGECPSCGTDVEPADSFCASCGEDLDAHRGDTGEANEEPTDEAATAGADADAEAAEETAPESLTLATRGEEIVVSDGDAVGRELRRIITEHGGEEDEAVRIHREHVRFVREDGQFYLVDLGRNPTRLNNIDMEQGDRKPVEPGDRIDLSGVITLEVREP